MVCGFESRLRHQVTLYIQRDFMRSVKSIASLKSAIARVAGKYLDYYNGFSYDFKKNGEEDLIRKLRVINPKIVFDVGANIGDWTRIALENYPSAEMHCFELSAVTYKNLLENVPRCRVILNNFGLAAEDGDFTYKDYGENSGVNTILLSATYHDADIEPRLVTAKLRKGDGYCDQKKIHFIDFLKIDVEGAEHLVLAGFENMLRKKAIRVIQFEYGYTNGDSKFLMRDFYEFFQKLGYLTGKVRKGFITFDNWTYKHNDFNSGPNYVAIRADDFELQNILADPSRLRY